MTISTDTLLQSNEFKQAVGADWVFLHDERRVLQKALDIQEYTDPEHDPMIPHVVVLEPGLKVSKIYDGYWYWRRPRISELHLDLMRSPRASGPTGGSTPRKPSAPGPRARRIASSPTAAPRPRPSRAPAARWTSSPDPVVELIPSPDQLQQSSIAALVEAS